MNEMNFCEGLALGTSMKSGLADDWIILILLAILLGGCGRNNADVTRKEIEELKASVEDLKGGAKHDE